jgi:hypothetical protein
MRIKSIRKLVKAAGFTSVAAGGVLTLATIRPESIPHRLSVETVALWGMWLLAFSFLAGLANFVLRAVEVARDAKADGDGSFLLTAWLGVRSLRLQWPLYKKETRDWMLANARITAQGEALRQIAAAKEEAKETSEAATRLLARGTASLASALEENVRLALQRDAAETETVRYKTALEYGSSLTELPPLSTATNDAIRVGLQKVKACIDSVEAVALDLWGPLKIESSRQPQGSPIGWLRANIEKYEARHWKNAGIELHNRLRLNGDARVVLGMWYERYLAWRLVLGRLAAALGKQLKELPRYDSWRAAEITLANVIKIEITGDAFERVCEVMTQANHDYGALSDPPPELATAAFGEYGAVVRRLASVTPDELQFLGLFCGVGEPMPGRQETYLANAVYQAGPRFVAEGLMTVRVSEDKKEHFTLTPMTYRAWLNSERNQPNSKTVAVDPHMVHGTGSSGGGAGRGSFTPPYIRPSPPITPQAPASPLNPGTEERRS